MSVSFNKLPLKRRKRSATLRRIMQASRARDVSVPRQHGSAKSLKGEFRKRFKDSFRLGGKKQASIAESFISTFTETLHAIPVSTKDAGELYLELSRWAKADAQSLSAVPDFKTALSTSSRS